MHVKDFAELMNKSRTKLIEFKSKRQELGTLQT